MCLQPNNMILRSATRALEEDNNTDISINSFSDVSSDTESIGTFDSMTDEEWTLAPLETYGTLNMLITNLAGTLRFMRADVNRLENEGNWNAHVAMRIRVETMESTLEWMESDGTNIPALLKNMKATLRYMRADVERLLGEEHRSIFVAMRIRIESMEQEIDFYEVMG